MSHSLHMDGKPVVIDVDTDKPVVKPVEGEELIFNEWSQRANFSTHYNTLFNTLAFNFPGEGRDRICA